MDGADVRPNTSPMDSSVRCVSKRLMARSWRHCHVAKSRFGTSALSIDLVWEGGATSVPSRIVSKLSRWRAAVT